jgi:hypothetical protein
MSKNEASRSLAKELWFVPHLWPTLPKCLRPEITGTIFLIDRSDHLDRLIHSCSDLSPAEQVSITGTYGESSYTSTPAFSKGINAKNPLGGRGVDAVQVSCHRRPPTDRPPDRPGRGRSVSGGCSQERADTQYPVVICLASPLSLAYSLSGKSTPFAENAILGVQKPSDCQVPSQDGSSYEVNRELSWMLPRCGRFRVKRDTCVTYCHPSSNLGRNLFPVRRFSYHTRFSGVQEHHATVLPCRLGSQSAPPRPGLRAVRRVQVRPRGGSIK